MDAQRAARINARLTPKRREVFDLMRARVAQGTWAELEPDGLTMLTIRWTAVRKFPDIMRSGAYATWGPDYDELVFVKLLFSGAFLMRHGPGPWVTARDSDLTVAKALAVVTDPVAALGLRPVPVLRWGLVWSDGADEGLRFEAADQVAPAGQERVVPGHAARHAVCDGAVALDDALNPVSCRACGAAEIRGRDVLFHPWLAVLFELTPEEAGRG